MLRVVTGISPQIEHKMFSFVTTNWRGRPLTSYQVIVNLVAGTTTNTGLRILAEWEQGSFPTGIEVSHAELAAVPLTGHGWHPEWNYEITPTQIPDKPKPVK